MNKGLGIISSFLQQLAIQGTMESQRFDSLHFEREQKLA